MGLINKNLFIAYNYITQFTSSNEDLLQIQDDGEVDCAQFNYEMDKFNCEIEKRLGYVSSMISTHAGSSPNPSLAYYKKEIEYVLKMHNGNLSERWLLWLDDIVKVHVTKDQKASMVESITCKKNIEELEKDIGYIDRTKTMVNNIFKDQYKKLAGTSFDLYVAWIDIMERQDNIITSFTMKDLM